MLLSLSCAVVGGRRLVVTNKKKTTDAPDKITTRTSGENRNENKSNKTVPRIFVVEMFVRHVFHRPPVPLAAVSQRTTTRCTAGTSVPWIFNIACDITAANAHERIHRPSRNAIQPVNVLARPRDSACTLGCRFTL